MANYLTDPQGKVVKSTNPLPVDDVSVSHDRIALSAESFTFKTGAAGLAGVVATDKAPIANLRGDQVGSYWRNPDNIVLENGERGTNGLARVTAVVETASSATVTILDPQHDLNALLEPTGSSGEYIIVLTDRSGGELYGWINAIVATGNSYVIDVYNSPALGTQSWVGTLGDFAFADGTKFAIYENTSSFVWVTGTILTREIEYRVGTNDVAQISAMSNGNFAIDYHRGRILYKKATTGTSDTATYSIRADSVVVTTTTGGAETVVDDAAFTVATTPVTPAGFLADETSPDSVTEGDAGAARMTLDRRQITAGQTTDDAAPETGTRTNLMGALADETTPDSVDEGDAGHLRMTLARKLYTAPDQSHDDVVTAHASMQGLEAKDFDGSALPNVVGAEGDVVRASGSLFGVQYVMPVNEDGSGRGGVDATLQIADTDVSATNGVPVTAEDVSNGNTTAYAASLVVKASAGKCFEIRGYNSGAAQFIQVHDAASLPADTAIPEDLIYVGATQNFSIVYERGKSFATGIVVCNSSTGPTKTIGTANCWFSSEFE